MVYESELASALGMSRTPVREAIRMLIMEELIEVLPQKGTRIMLISQKKVEETRFIRESLEISAFKEITRVWDSNKEPFSNIQYELEKLLHTMDQSAKSMDALTFLNTDEAFHSYILQTFQNHTLMNVVYNMRGHINRVRYLSLNEVKDMAELVEEHRQILQALTTKNEAKMVELMIGHLRKIRTDISRLSKQFPQYFMV